MPTTLGSHKSSSENLEEQRCRFKSNKSKISHRHFLIPGATTFITFSQVSSSLYAALFGITQDTSGNPYLVTKFLPLILGCNFFPFAINITGPFTPSALPNQRIAIENLESLQFLSWWGLLLLPIFLTLYHYKGRRFFPNST